MPPLPEKFRAAIVKGVRDIDTNGELRKLNISEKRQLLAILREHDDCPEGWKNIDPEKQRIILQCLYQSIDRLLDPEKLKAASARNHKRRRENGKQKEWDDRKCAKITKALCEANAQAILDNKGHKEPTWPEDTLEKKATEIVEMIVEKCGPDGFVHVFVGAWPGKDLNKAVEAECFGKGRNRHAVFIDGGKFVRYRDASTHVKLLTPYYGTNCCNADELERRVQKKLIDMGWPQHRRMFVCRGKGSCKGKRAAKIPFPYYTGVLVCAQSMEQIGIRLATKKDHAPKRKERDNKYKK
jgi:hypothetical protein